MFWSLLFKPNNLRVSLWPCQRKHVRDEDSSQFDRPSRIGIENDSQPDKPDWENHLLLIKWKPALEKQSSMLNKMYEIEREIIKNALGYSSGISITNPSSLREHQVSQRPLTLSQNRKRKLTTNEIKYFFFFFFGGGGGAGNGEGIYVCSLCPQWTHLDKAISFFPNTIKI